MKNETNRLYLNLSFSGNQIEYSSLSKKQQELEPNKILNI